MRNLLPLLAVLLHFPVAVLADNVADPEVASTTCPLLETETPIATEYGSAGIMKNLAESPDSIRAIAARLLDSALSRDIGLTEAGCVDQCANGTQPEVVYRVAPIAFLPDEEQDKLCVTLEEQTSKFPMRFERREFDSVQGVTDWITAFSQGRGDDGKLLYEQCGSNCSPRYTFMITQRDKTYRVNTDVLCGLARDRDNDQYLISTSLRRTCSKQ